MQKYVLLTTLSLVFFACPLQAMGNPMAHAFLGASDPMAHAILGQIRWFQKMKAIEEQMVRVLTGQEDGSNLIFIPASQSTAEILKQYPEKNIITIPLSGDASKILGMTIVGPIMLRNSLDNINTDLLFKDQTHQ